MQHGDGRGRYASFASQSGDYRSTPGGPRVDLRLAAVRVPANPAFSTAQEVRASALPASPPSGVCGLSQSSGAPYPRFAQAGEAPDGSPSSLARPGPAGRKTASGQDRNDDKN